MVTASIGLPSVTILPQNLGHPLSTSWLLPAGGDVAEQVVATWAQGFEKPIIRDVLIWVNYDHSFT
jgi:hypothetical protein